MSEAMLVPQEGVLLPDFTMYFRDGRVLQRRELKGRLHAVIYFPSDRPLPEGRAMLEPLAARASAWRAARAVVLVVVSADNADSTAPQPFETAIDRDRTVRARFGVGPGGALFVADRYGEIALRADGTIAAAGDSGALPLDAVAPTLELLEMRCSL